MFQFFFKLFLVLIFLFILTHDFINKNFRWKIITSHIFLVDLFSIHLFLLSTFEILKRKAVCYLLLRCLLLESKLRKYITGSLNRGLFIIRWIFIKLFTVVILLLWDFMWITLRIHMAEAKFLKQVWAVLKTLKSLLVVLFYWGFLLTLLLKFYLFVI